MENYVIFVAGPPASGKTSFSAYLSDKLGVLCVNKDFTKEILCDTIGFANRAENKILSVAAFNLFKHLLEQSMKVNRPIILESNFTPDEGVELSALIEKYGYKALTVLFTADLHVLHKRFLARLGDTENVRHAAHRAVGLDNFEDFKAVAVCNGFSAGGFSIKVDTTSFASINYDNIVTQIKHLLMEA